MNYSKKLIRGTLVILFFLVISSIFGYTLKFVFARFISVEDIGLFYSVLSFVTFFVFLRDLGLSESLLYFIPRFLIDKVKAKIKSALILVLRIQLLNGSFFIVLMILLSGGLSKYYFKNPASKLILISLGIYFLIDGLNEILTRIFQAYQNMFLTESIEFSFQIFSFIFLLIIIFFGLPFNLFGFAYVFASIITAVIFSIIFYKFFFPDFLNTKTRITKKFKKKMLNYSKPAMFGRMATQIFAKQTIFFLTLFTGLEAVAYYVMARALAKMPFFLYTAFIKVFSPMMSELWKKKALKKFIALFNELITLSYLFTIPISFSLFLFSREVLRIIYGETFVIASLSLKLFAVYFLLFNLTALIRRMFLSMGHPKKSRDITYITLVTNIIFNVLLIPTFGLIGAVISDLVSSVFSLIYSLYLKKKFTPISIKVAPLIKIFFSSSFFVICAIILKTVIKTNLYIEIIVTICVSGTLYLSILFLLKLLSLKKIKNLINITLNRKVGASYGAIEKNEKQK